MPTTTHSHSPPSVHGRGPRPAAGTDFDRRQLLVAACALAVACGVRVPSGRLERRFQQSAGRLWIVVEMTSGDTLDGSLIGLDERSLLLRSHGTDLHLMFEDIDRVHLPGPERSASTVVVVLSGLVIMTLIGLAVLLLLALIVVLTKSSCPFVYTVGPDGRRRLVGEAYSGANAKNLARPDTIPLSAHSGERIEIVLADEADETQYTDLTELLLVDHEPGVRVLARHDGGLVEVSGPTAPNRVTDLEGRDVTAALTEDDREWLTDMAAAAARTPRPTEEGLVARFATAPEGAVLELVLRNSPFLDYLSREYWAALGGRHGAAIDRGRDPSRAQMLQQRMRDAGVQVRLEVRQGDDPWRDVAWMAPLGFAAHREVAVLLPGVAANQPLEVRLRGGVGFLIVRSVKLSGSRGEPGLMRIPPDTATGPGDVDERDRLRAVDGKPQVLPARGTELVLGFPLPPPPVDTERSLFLHTHGYYEIHPIPQAKLRPAVVLPLTRRPETLSAYGLTVWSSLAEEVAGGIRLEDD